MRTYYAAEGGTGRGFTPDDPAGSWRELEILPGDQVLFRRGSLFRDALLAPSGKEGAPVRFGAYGEGEAPVFSGSVDLSDPACWVPAGDRIWRCVRETGSEACSFVFDGSLSCGILVWDMEDLDGPGKWHDTRIGTGEGRGEPAKEKEYGLFLWCEVNPGTKYGKIECALYGARRMVTAEAWAEFRDLEFRGSGVHGYQAINAHHIRMARCAFRHIGGAVWDRKKRIRFGNAFELWDDCHDIVMEGCTCSEVYDSCFTHQGPRGTCVPARRLTVKDNVFERYGMAAYEARDRVPLESSFTGNTCLDAGLGFALQDETPPRRSEIWPEPMGHHLFLWRMDHATPGGSMAVEKNFFGPAPYGASVYARIAPEALAQFGFRGNRYSPASERLLPDFTE